MRRFSVALFIVGAGGVDPGDGGESVYGAVWASPDERNEVEHCASVQSAGTIIGVIAGARFIFFDVELTPAEERYGNVCSLSAYGADASGPDLPSVGIGGALICADAFADDPLLPTRSSRTSPSMGARTTGYGFVISISSPAATLSSDKPKHSCKEPSPRVAITSAPSFSVSRHFQNPKP
jgi:hypothetical protein